MGYRSDVAIAMKKADFNAMSDKAEKLSADILEFLDVGLYYGGNFERDIEEDDEWVILRWHGVKWYRNEPKYFPHIQFIEDYLKDIPEHDFIRIGESSDDVEEYYGNGEGRIYINRTIELSRYFWK